ncbi:IclR family transcriptional regulator [Chelativorans sp.]|uniref:IclR family transcriptional regulator n=1 Tax=Chelativorans sp. TaxID=2203393 RepID=UPI002810DB92|nr:IclR family transcriptional regulator [Chelativorans sp.]
MDQQELPTRARPPATEDGAVKSATRVLDLFEFLGRWDAEKTHTAIAEELGIPKSSLTQLLKTLVSRDYLTYVPATKGYALGPAIVQLATRINEGNDLVSIAQGTLAWVTSETQESCALNYIKGDKSEVVACVMSPHRLLYHMRQGDTAPLYATSGGKALLAFLPNEMLEEYLARVTFEQVTPNTITNADDLRRDLEQVRSQGVAFVVEEFTPGIAGVARPILSKSGYPMASINVAVPVARFDAATRDLCIVTLRKAVDSIHQRLHRAGTTR